MAIFEAAELFLTTGRQTQTEDALWYCEDRGQVKGRQPNWYKLLSAWTREPNQAALLLAIIGELANNSFDHNLGVWKDYPGCLVGLYFQAKTIEIVVADRGQGIVSSLANQLPKNTESTEILRVAFEERISGRAPERRGNGLKFVCEKIDGMSRRLFCFSGNASYARGRLRYSFSSSLKDMPGTLTAIEWDIG